MPSSAEEKPIGDDEEDLLPCGHLYQVSNGQK